MLVRKRNIQQLFSKFILINLVILQKKIIDVINENPIIHSKQLNLWSWMSRYYMTSVGEIMIAALPASLKITAKRIGLFT